MKASLPDNEQERIAALKQYNILDTPPEQAFDDIASLAALICNTPISLITLVDSDREWFKAKIGLNITEAKRDYAFCAHAILEYNELLVIPDASADRRFADNPLVTGEPFIRFYAGAPLVTREGFALGSLCVIDRVPRQLNREQMAALRALSRKVVTELELRHHIELLSRAVADRDRVHQELEHVLEELKRQVLERTEALGSSEMRLSLALEAAQMGAWHLDLTTGSVTTSAGRGPISGLDAAVYPKSQQGLLALVHPEDRPGVCQQFRRVIEAGGEYCAEFRIAAAELGERWVHVRGGLLRDASGKAVAMTGVDLDITTRKLDEEELLIANQELSALNRIVTSCTGSLDLQNVLERVLDEALHITGLEGGTICLLGADQVLQLAAERGVSAETIRDLTEHPSKVGSCLCGACASEQVPLILPDREAVFCLATPEAVRQEEICFHAAYPFVTGNRCVGVLCVFTRTQNKPSKRSLKVLETVTGQVALAVENARLYRETARHAAAMEERVTERTTELEAKNLELERVNRLFVGRELRMRELKERIRELEKKLEEP